MKATNPLVIAVDIGTSSAKAISVTRSGQIMAVAQKSYPLIHPQPGWVELDPVILLEAVRTVILELLGNVPRGCQVHCISFSTAMHGLMAMDASGNPLTRLLTWADTRSDEETKEIKNSPAGRDLYASTGLPMHPMSPLCKIRWIHKNLPGVAEKAAMYGGIKEYLFFLATGRWPTDFASAAAMGMLDIHTKTWHGPALAQAGISSLKLPQPMDPLHAWILEQPALETFLGPENVKAMKGDGLPPAVALVLGSTDGPLANLGSGAMRPGLLALTIGTSGAVRYASNRALTDPAGRTFSYPFLADSYIIGGPVNNGGVILKWFTEQILRQPFEDAHAFETFLAEAVTVPPGAGGLVCLPWFLGERAPVWDAHATGMFLGMQMHHRRAHMMRALVEGISFSLKSIADILAENGGSFESVLASGGFAASDHWVQMIADIFQKPVYQVKEADASALGAAILGWMHLEKQGDPEAFRSWQSDRKIFYPRAENTEAYQKAFEKFQSFAQHYAKHNGSF